MGCGKLRAEGALQLQRENRANRCFRKASLGRRYGKRNMYKQVAESCARRERYRGKNVQIVCGLLRAEGSLQHGGWKGNRANSLQKASARGTRQQVVESFAGKSVQHGGRIRNRAHSLRKASLGKALQHDGRKGKRANSSGKGLLRRSDTAWWTEGKQCK